MFICDSCKRNATSNQVCKTQDSITLYFQPPFDFTQKDKLVIDGIVFTHVQYNDSISLGNYLPMELMIYDEREGKQLKSKTNTIAIARILWSHLKKSENYNLQRAPELITTGKLTFERKDGKAIEMCYPNNYGMTILKND